MHDHPTHCSNSPGQLHGYDCHAARCADTGHPRLDRGHTGAACNTRWSGHRPGENECRDCGLLIHPRADNADLLPLPDLHRLHAECEWGITRQRMALRGRETAAGAEAGQ
ncbi:hypothetical protein [Streptomyces marianii]|uniref:Uncharacterized protein n=1 Tax=Streptomyces marianii TaxID=1817406 RepID=A0A5R9DRZ8_9ACTN|nr:hypothetical protein [Streptomyces marianii]TLQ39279.1 hypothetical protein FEF34_38450 [Streptomyces marianii]